MQLPGEYAQPSGGLWLALGETQIAGCAALRQLNANACELRRVFVRPAWRGKGIARQLLDQAIGAARKGGYREMRLETLACMGAAIALYSSIGFRPIAPYTDSAGNDDVLAMSLPLSVAVQADR